MFKPTIKYEIVVGLLNHVNGYTTAEAVQQAWQEYAKQFYEKNDVYVSAIANVGSAVYHRDWGCPFRGEPSITFNCTANPEFIKDMCLYEEGVLYISMMLKEHFYQNTVTITKLPSYICYLSDKDNEEEE